MSTTTTSDMVRVRDVAKRMDVHRSTIYRAIEAGHLVALRVGSGRGALRISTEALDAYLGACRTTPVNHAGGTP